MPVSPKTLDIIEYRKQYPCVSSVVIGNTFGVTRQRASKILKKAGLRASSIKRGTARKCPVCGRRKDAHSQTCRVCYKERHWVTCVCDGCGKVFQRQQSKVLRSIARGAQSIYCNKECNRRSRGSKRRR